MKRCCLESNGRIVMLAGQAAIKSPLVLCFIIIFTVIVPGLSAENADEREQLKEAFCRWSPEWEESVVDEYVDAILGLAVRKKGSISQQEVADIAKGLENLPYINIIKATSHPLRKERVKQRLLYAVDNYLEFGPGSSQLRNELSAQIESYLAQFENDLYEILPEESEIVSTARENVLQWMKGMCNNPLRRDFKKPFGKSALNTIRSSWQTKLIELKSSYAEIERPEDIEAREMVNKVFCFELSNHMMQVFMVHKNDTIHESLPIPETLREVEDQFRQQMSDIMDIEADNRSRKRYEQKLELKHEMFKQEHGLTDEFYLDQVLLVGNNLESADLNSQAMNNSSQSPNKPPTRQQSQSLSNSKNDADILQTTFEPNTSRGKFSGTKWQDVNWSVYTVLFLCCLVVFLIVRLKSKGFHVTKERR